jgi:putative transposase
MLFITHFLNGFNSIIPDFQIIYKQFPIRAFMARQLRITFEGAWYHVMNRGINHNNIFFNNDNRIKFLELLKESVDIYGIEIHAFCLMDNHYHLIIHTPRGNISHAIRHVNSKYAQYINLVLNRDGPLFKGRFKAILICADDYLIRLSRYIHRNPLEAGIVKKLENYQWSSYQDYIKKRTPYSLLKTNVITESFGKKDFPIEYKKYVELDEDSEIENIYKNAQIKTVLGSDEFCQKIFDEIKAHSMCSEIVGVNQIITPPDFEEILKITADYFNTSIENILKNIPQLNNFSRNIAIWLCRKIGGYSLKEIGERMNITSIKTISSVIRRVERSNSLVPAKNKIISLLSLSRKQSGDGNKLVSATVWRTD